MKLRALIFTVALVPAHADVSQTAGNGAVVPQSIWKVDSSGTAHHLLSGLSCPADVAGFKRSQLTFFDRGGFDVSCTYKGPGGWITMYLTRRATGSLADAFDQAKRELLQFTPDSVPLPDDGQKTLPGPLSFERIVYAQHAGQMWSGIWVTDFSGWTLEFRATYKPDAQAAMLDEMSEMARRAEDAAGKHLALCAKSAAPARDGKIVTDKDAITTAPMGASLLGGMGAIVGDKISPLRWCAEDMAAGKPVVIWHAVHDDGSDGVADRATPVTDGDPPVLASAPDLLFSDEKAGNNAPNWLITLSTKTKTWIFAIYSGRPPADALATLMMDIMEGKARAVGGYSANGNSISIDMPDK